MIYAYLNAAQTMVAATDEAGHVTILEPGQAGLDAAIAGPVAPFTPPPEPDPLEVERAGMVVSRLQARAALLQAGLLDKVEKAVTGGLLTGSAVDPLTRLAWNEASEFRRTSPTIRTLAGILGLDDAALDDLFRAARRIEF